MNEEILNTLKKIRDICDKCDDCDKCSFGSFNADCMIMKDHPQDWKFKGDDEIYRYFE